MESDKTNMEQSNRHPDAIKYVRADRISTGDKEKSVEPENVRVVREAPVTIDVESVETYTLLCTPIDKRALAVGFLLGEGVIESLADIKILKVCDDDPGTVRVRLKSEIPRIGDSGRNLLIVSSCGACGSENLQKRIDALPRVGDRLRFEARLLRSVNEALRERQSLFEISGGTHAAAIFDERGEIVSFAEDTGRHNALDKAIGKCLRNEIATAGKGAALTSRLSLEMVSRCARAGIELITAVSAPTSLALDVANNCGITLCAFVRETRATVFTHPARIIGLNK
ncbi:MAG: formate dehydrogenase accessory sulfurtransferase FdhD [candidate division Zixibacteria bacterium]|nr:formate dehydrogenase accessory sulfurtransferase FdhD [candidate division Zixibacteria bacterium]